MKASWLAAQWSKSSVRAAADSSFPLGSTAGISGLIQGLKISPCRLLKVFASIAWSLLSASGEGFFFSSIFLKSIPSIQARGVIPTRGRERERIASTIER